MTTPQDRQHVLLDAIAELQARRAVLGDAPAAFTAIVTQHGGEVLRYVGDNLKVAFGAHGTDGTREDDAERAVYCGLALLAEAARRGDEVKRVHGHHGFNDREVRQRVRNNVPWHRDVVEALAQSNAVA